MKIMSFIIENDIGSLEYISEDGQEKAIFKLRAEYDCYRYS